MAIDIKDIVSDMVCEIEKRLDGHMNEQPYSIKCSLCGSELNLFTTDVDIEFDLSIYVDVCDCQKKGENQ